ncbi:MAG: FtsW/RodA/SpoVE family cell cycle protein [Dehalococcoidia bacterium]
MTSAAPISSPTWRNFDPLLLVAALALTGYGALLIYSASLPRGAEGVVISEPVVRHIATAAAGAAAMFVAARVDYRALDVVAWLAYGFGLLILAAVLVVGSEQFGSRRSFDLGFTLIQASEIAKLLTIVGLAKLMSDYRERMTEWPIFLLSLGLATLPALLVFVEPDAGSAVVFLILWAVMAAFAGARIRQFLILGVVAVALIPVGLAVGVQDYQEERIRIFIDPTEDAQGAGFNVLQAETSVGSGGLLGKGLTKGTQTQLDFLRTQTTDFIFSVLGEELGFVGAMVLFALFLLLILRGLRAIMRATDPFGQLLVAGIITLIAVQAFIAVGVNIRIVPVTGIPLPFISVGNASLLVLFVALGIIQSVLLHRQEGR